MKLVKRQGKKQSPVHAALNTATIDRRTFLKRSETFVLPTFGAPRLGAAPSAALPSPERTEATTALRSIFPLLVRGKLPG